MATNLDLKSIWTAPGYRTLTLTCIDPATRKEYDISISEGNLLMPVSLEHTQRVLQHQERIARLMRRAHQDLPCKNEGFAEVASDGSCLRCGADQGEACR